jgi:hypothetical protein
LVNCTFIVPLLKAKRGRDSISRHWLSVYVLAT